MRYPEAKIAREMAELKQVELALKIIYDERARDEGNILEEIFEYINSAIALGHTSVLLNADFYQRKFLYFRTASGESAEEVLLMMGYGMRGVHANTPAKSTLRIVF